MVQCGTCSWILPALIAVGVPITMFLTYGIAVQKDHVEPFWPYISDTGTTPPESCIFGQLLNMGAVILSFIMYCRYRQIREWTALPSRRVSPCLNKLAFVLALISCFGLSIVANFQEYNVLVVHLLGALLCFVMGTIYCFIQVWITRSIEPDAKFLFWLRLMLATVSMCSTILALVPVSFAVKKFNGDDILHWRPEHAGYSLHVLSTSMEWILVLSFCFFIGSFYVDFRHITIHEPTFAVHNLESGIIGSKNYRV